MAKRARSRKHGREASEQTAPAVAAYLAGYRRRRLRSMISEAEALLAAAVALSSQEAHERTPAGRAEAEERQRGIESRMIEEVTALYDRERGPDNVEHQQRYANAVKAILAGPETVTPSAKNYPRQRFGVSRDVGRTVYEVTPEATAIRARLLARWALAQTDPAEMAWLDERAEQASVELVLARARHAEGIEAAQWRGVSARASSNPTRRAQGARDRVGLRRDYKLLRAANLKKRWSEKKAGAEAVSELARRRSVTPERIRRMLRDAQT